MMGAMDAKFTAVFRSDGDWWAAYVEELPGANTQGRTLDEARENLKEAAKLILEVNREISTENYCGGGGATASQQQPQD